MARAVRVDGGLELIWSPLQLRIGASLDAWEQQLPAIQAHVGGLNGWTAAGRVLEESWRVGPWQLSQSSCVWPLAFETPALLPLCDVIDVLTADADDRLVNRYVTIEQLLAWAPRCLVSAAIAGGSVEWLQLAFTAAEAAPLLAAAAEEMPLVFSLEELGLDEGAQAVRLELRTRSLSTR